jgi:hypothetical protein
MVHWSSSVETNGLMNQWRQNFQLYYGTATNRTIGYAPSYGIFGDYSEYMSVRVNHFRNVLQHMLNLIYANRRGLKSAAANTDPDALNSCNLFDSILEYTMRIKKAERFFKKTGEIGLLTGTGAILAEWDTFKGTPYATDGNIIANTGDLRIRSKTPWDFYTDMNKQEWEDVDWVIVRDYVNKFVLAANFPDMAERIIKLRRFEPISDTTYFVDGGYSDDVPVYKFYHKKIPGLMPDGRFAMIFDKDLVAYDGPNPYDDLPLFLCKPNDWIGSFYGYSPSNDLAPLQMFYDLVTTQIATNVTAYGVPCIIGRNGSDLQPTELIGGMKYIKVNPGVEPPQALNLLSTNPELYQLSQMLVQLMETVSGVNSVVRGNPESNLKSKVALAFVQSQAIQFMSGFERSVADMEEDVGNFMLKIYKKYANTEQVVSVIGKDKKYEIKRWTKEDIDLVQNVYVDRVDALSQTAEGKWMMAEALLQKGAITDPQTFITVATTGQYDSKIKYPVNQEKLIRLENQRMLDGIKPIAVIDDDHDRHLAEHQEVISDIDTRMNSSIVDAYLAHMEEHKQLKLQKAIDDAHFQATVQMSVQQMMQPPMPQIPQQMPEGEPPPPEVLAQQLPQ